MALYRHGAFAADDWRALGEDEAAPFDGKAILTLSQWDEARGQLRDANVPLGLRLEPGDKVEAIAPDLGRFALVAIRFPKFTDGRGYSMARQIRGSGKFCGELRAIGDILFDQLQYLSRCGFDAFEISNPATIRLIEAGRGPAMDLFYQPGLDAEEAETTRPWARRMALRRT